MISFSSLSKRPGATLAGIVSVAITSVVLLCGAGSVPVENFLPQGVMQGDLNAGGYNLTNAGSIYATNVVINGTPVAGGTPGTANFVYESTNFIASSGVVYGVAPGVTCTPVASPSEGNWFAVFDISKGWTASHPAVGTSGNNFIDTSHPSPTAGPYTLDQTPYVGQGMIYFVWKSSASTWSVQ